MHKIVKNNDLELWTQWFGDPLNPVCLLISGAGAEATFWSTSFCEKLVKSGYGVVRYDHRDVGLSSAVDYKKHPYFLDDLARDAINILDAYNIEQVHIIGHSMGGYIAQHLAIEYPARILSITCIASGPVGSTPKTEQPLSVQEKAVLDETWEIMLANKATENFEKSCKGYMTVWKHLHGEIPIDDQKAYAYTKDMYVRSKHKPGIAKNHMAVMDDVMRNMPERKGDMDNISVPTLIIHGDRDPLVLLPRGGQAIAESVSHASLHIIPGMGHMIFNDALEDKIIQIIATFLKDIR